MDCKWVTLVYLAQLLLFVQEGQSAFSPGDFSQSLTRGGFGVCTRTEKTVRYHQQTRYSSEYVRQTCTSGFWRVRRCTNIYRQVARYDRTSSQQSRTILFCCQGYYRSGGSCYAICSPSCRNGGRCIRPYTCSCSRGWRGSYCQTPICSQSCRNGGACTRPSTCSCSRGWSGSYCQTSVCSPSCRNGGRCTQPNTCSCSRGWIGSYCQTVGGLSCSSYLRNIAPKLFPHCSGVPLPLPCIYGNWSEWTFGSEVVSTTQCESGRAWPQTKVRNALRSSCESKIQQQKKYICQPSQRETVQTMQQVLKLGKIVETTNSPKKTNTTRGKRMSRCPSETIQANNRICGNVCGSAGKRSIFSDFQNKRTVHSEKIKKLHPGIPVEPFYIPDNGYHQRHRRQSEYVRNFLFILDSSGSINMTDFTQKKEVLATIARRLCGHIRVAMITYSTEINLEFCFDCYTSRDELAEAIKRAPYHNQMTHTHKAMKCVHEQLLRPGLCNLSVSDSAELDVITLTDGRHNGQCSVTLSSAMKMLEEASLNIYLYAIGYGDVDLAGVQEVVGKKTRKHIFVIENFDFVSLLASYLEQDYCIKEDGDPVPGSSG